MRWLLAAFICLLVNAAHPASVTLTWNASPDAGIGEYLVYWGLNSGIYPNSISAGNSLTATVSGLNPGARYYFVAKAKNTNGVESAPSNEINYLVPDGPNLPPTIGAISDVTNSLSTAVSFTVGDPDGPVSSLTLTAVSSNPGLIPNEGIVFLGIGTNRTMIISPAPRQIGASIITVTISDGIAISTRQFAVTIRNPLSPANFQVISGSGTNVPMAFDGISTTMDFGGVDPLGGVTNGMVLMWLFMDPRSDPFGGIISDIDDSGSYGWGITRGATNNLHIVSRSGDMGAADSGPVPESSWAHIAVSFARVPHLWVNGEEFSLTMIGSFPIAPALNVAPLRFGSFRGIYHFRGRLENVAIYTNDVPLISIQAAAADVTHRTVPPGYYTLYP